MQILPDNIKAITKILRLVSAYRDTISYGLLQGKNKTKTLKTKTSGNSDICMNYKAVCLFFEVR